MKRVESFWFISVEDQAVIHQAVWSGEPVSCLLVWWFKKVFFIRDRMLSVLLGKKKESWTSRDYRVETKHACCYCYTLRLPGFVWVDEQCSRCGINYELWSLNHHIHNINHDLIYNIYIRSYIQNLNIYKTRNVCAFMFSGICIASCMTPKAFYVYKRIGKILCAAPSLIQVYL